MRLTYADDVSIDGQLHFVDTSIMCLLTTIWASLPHCLPRVTAIQRVFIPSKADHSELVSVSVVTFWSGHSRDSLTVACFIN